MPILHARCTTCLSIDQFTAESSASHPLFSFPSPSAPPSSPFLLLPPPPLSARIFNLYPRTGVIAAGSDADVIILNPASEKVIRASSHHSRIDTNIYEGWTVKVGRGGVRWMLPLDVVFF